MNLTPGGAEDRIVEALKSLRRYLNYSEALAEIIGIVAENVSGDRKPKKRELKRKSAQGLLRYLVCNYLDEESEIRLALCSLGLLAEYPEWKLTERRNSYILTTGYTGKRSLPDVALVQDLSADELRRRRNSLEKYENDLYAKIAVGVTEVVNSIEALDRLVTEAISKPVVVPEWEIETPARGEKESILQADPQETLEKLEDQLFLDLNPKVAEMVGRDVILLTIQCIRKEMQEEASTLDEQDVRTYLWLGMEELEESKEAEWMEPESVEPESMQAKQQRHLQQAFGYLTTAAEAGVGEAMYLIALLYYYGYGVERNMESFLSWLKLAASQGSEMAKRKLEELERMRL